jgi:hypothetical protein
VKCTGKVGEKIQVWKEGDITKLGIKFAEMFSHLISFAKDKTFGT